MKQSALSQSIAEANGDASQLELERQFKEQLDLAQKQIEQNPAKTAAEYINDARAQVNELITICLDMKNSLRSVGDFAPFFDMNFLRKEGVTDVDKIDQNYLLTIGRQLLADYRTFEASASELVNRVNAVKASLDTVGDVNAPDTLDRLSDIVMTATTIQSDYVSWGEQFQRILVSSMTDLVNHLNPLRPVERRIIL